MDLIRTPVRVATSRPARQTYLNTILFLTSSALLLGLAVIAYVLFYFNYVPQISIERIIHLQYGDGPHPYGIAYLDSSIVHEQPYDISLSLHVPRSPPNLATGNFMLSVSLLSASYKPPLPSSAPPSALKPSHSTTISPSDILFSSRRAAILTYTSRLVSLSERLVSLPLYVLGLRRESEILNVPMAELATFKGKKQVPAYILLELQTGQDVQVYDVRIHFTARFRGLRWLMYNHRFISFFAFTSAFWFAEVLFAALGWLVVRLAFGGKDGGVKEEAIKRDEAVDNKARVKKEEEETDDPDLSDTPRTFPTYGRQPPLRYVPKVKAEAGSEEYVIDETTIQPLAAEADDEDEVVVDYGAYRGKSDSGIGTSFSEGGERAGLARRRSRGGSGVS